MHIVRKPSRQAVQQLASVALSTATRDMIVVEGDQTSNRTVFHGFARK